MMCDRFISNENQTTKSEEVRVIAQLFTDEQHYCLPVNNPPNAPDMGDNWSVRVFDLK
jgi:hypothetical protein